MKFDHYPRTAPPCPNNTGWRDKSNPQPGDWQHICTSGECPSGNYYVSAMETDGSGTYYVMAGPFPTHAEALAAVPPVKEIADAKDPRAFWKAWGTLRKESNEPGVLNRLGLWPPIKETLF